MQEPNIDENLRYKVPLVPIVPVLSIFFNIALIINLNFLTWARFIVWMTIGKHLVISCYAQCSNSSSTIGFSIYAFYGIKHSKASYGSELSTAINKNWTSIGGSGVRGEINNVDDHADLEAAPTHTTIH